METLEKPTAEVSGLSVSQNASDTKELKQPDTEASEPRAQELSVATFLVGWRLHVTTLALCLSLLLVSIEVSIVSTSLVTIANQFRSFQQNSWIVTAYLITFTGFLIIWAKLSDIFGRKTTIISALVIFIIFSGACGGSQTLTELIIFRAFQGLGGAGVYSMVMVFLPELVPASKFAMYTAVISGMLGLSYIIGPLVGGAINSNGDWKWIFLLNLPAGAVALLVLVIAIPNNFPYHESNKDTSTEHRAIFSRATFMRIDNFGTFLLLGTFIFIGAALEEAGTKFAWSSAVIIVFLVLCVVFLASFVLWERHITLSQGVQEPVFTWRFLQNRVFAFMLLDAILVGAPFTAAVIQIPQVFQAVGHLSPLNAGIRLLPMLLTNTFGGILSGVLNGRLQFPPILTLLAAGILQIIGSALLGTLPVGTSIPNAIYGYEAILGLGTGIAYTTLVVWTPFVVEKRDTAVAMGAITQFRTFGGVVGLGAAVNALNTRVKGDLGPLLSMTDLDRVLQSTDVIASLPQAIQEPVQEAFMRGYNLQWLVLVGFAAAQVFAVLGMWERSMRRMVA